MSQAPISMKVSDTIAAYRIVKMGSAAHTVGLADTLTATPFGVTQDNATNSNQAVPVGVNGIVRVYCNDTIAVGGFVASNATGQGIPVTAAQQTAGNYAIGIALEAVSATGTIASVLFQPYRF